MATTTSVARLEGSNILEHTLGIYGVKDKSDDARNRFVHKHIAMLESAENEVVARSGFVLRRANEGFGLGYRVPMALIAMGHALLGIDLSLAAPAMASNPVALTCAAVGAIYYGYAALNEVERQAINQRVAEAFSFGAELVQSIVKYCVETLKSILDSEGFAYLKNLVSEYATSFGLTISDITMSITDRIATLAASTSQEAGRLVSSAASSVGDLANQAVDAGNRAVSYIKDKKPSE